VGEEKDINVTLGRREKKGGETALNPLCFFGGKKRRGIRALKKKKKKKSAHEY